jgi:hypothetical protein
MCNLTLCAQEPNVVVEVLKSSNSVEVIQNYFDSSLVKVTEFSFSDFSITANGIEFTEPKFIYLWEGSSILARLDSSALSEIITIETDSSFEFYKIYSIDSLECFRCAAFSFSNSLKTDSLLEEVNSSIKSGVKWNELKYFISDQDIYDTYKGSFGWNPLNSFNPIFSEAIRQHPKESIFAVQLAELDLSYIVYKTDENMMKPLKKVLLVSVLK